jgi:hypothetical protein
LSTVIYHSLSISSSPTAASRLIYRKGFSLQPTRESILSGLLLPPTIALDWAVALTEDVCGCDAEVRDTTQGITGDK